MKTYHPSMALYLKPSVVLCAAISWCLMPAYGLDLDRGSVGFWVPRFQGVSQNKKRLTSYPGWGTGRSSMVSNVARACRRCHLSNLQSSCFNVFSWVFSGQSSNTQSSSAHPSGKSRLICSSSFSILSLIVESSIFDDLQSIW